MCACVGTLEYGQNVQFMTKLAPLFSNGMSLAWFLLSWISQNPIDGVFSTLVLLSFQLFLFWWWNGYVLLLRCRKRNVLGVFVPCLINLLLKLRLTVSTSHTSTDSHTHGNARTHANTVTGAVWACRARERLGFALMYTGRLLHA